MQPLVTLATLALVISVGGALRVVACEDGSYAMEPVVTVPQQVASCTSSCATDEQVTTPPQVGECGSVGCARPDPKLETVLKDLDNATVRALDKSDKSPVQALQGCYTSSCATPESTVSTPPAASCYSSNC